MHIALHPALATPKPEPKSLQNSVSRRDRVITLVLAVLLATAGFLYYIGLFTSNFRTVLDGRLYRSAQLSPEALRRAIDLHGFKSIVNLRGVSRSGSWYFGQLDACRASQVDHVSIEMNNDVLPHPDALRELLSRFENGPFPMLIHCRRGADRTGLAAVIYLVVVEGRPLDEAEQKQLTWRQGHITVFPDANDQFLSLYRATSRGQRLRTWILETYPGLHTRLATN